MSEIKLTADSGGGTTSIKAPSTTTSNADVVLKLPVADGSSGQVIKTDGSGQLSFTSNAGTTINNNADNRVITGSGTANTLNGESNVTIDGSGRLLIGTTTEGHAAGDNLTVADSGNSGITIRSGSSNVGVIYFSDGTSGAAEYRGAVQYRHDDNALAFYSNGGEKLRIDSSGDLGIGTTSPNIGSHSKTLTVSNTGTGARSAVEIEGNTANAHGVLEFYNNGTLVSGLNSRGSDRLQFVTGSSGDVRGQFTSNGLNFGNDTAAANALNDYEEGTFTPSFNMTGGGHNITYSVQQGNYTKIGNMVSIEIYLNIGTINANGSGVLRIGGLPFTKTGRYGGLNISYIYGLNNVEIIGALVDVNSTQIFLHTLSQASSNYHSANTSVAAAFTNASEIMLNGIYFAA